MSSKFILLFELIKILHVITGLSRGGAEKMLFKLVRAMNPERFTNVIISLTDKNVVGRELEASGLKVFELNMTRGRFSPAGFCRLTRLLRQEHPDIVQTWLYHSDLAGGLAARLAGRIPIAWNVRNSSLEVGGEKLTTILTMKVCALLSPLLPTKIVFCSENSRQIHAAQGYSVQKMVVIPNGIDLQHWKADPKFRAQTRASLGIRSDQIVVGHIGRFHPQKNHRGFIEAACLASKAEPAFCFVLCGDGIDMQNPSLSVQVNSSGIQEKFLLLGARNDIPALMNAFDVICCSSSFGEAFPNVLLEGMACEVPGVTSDIGDSRYVVGDTGEVVPPKDSSRLAEALLKMARFGPAGRSELGKQARRRAEALFDIRSVARMYESLYTGLRQGRNSS